ncbi:kinetochore protein mis13 [Pseudozyma hubeiensis SY62]|uniref:Kinetochore protein mis13 n=1 Tax=Pseudozyma hubeiensis (strain SY62) TaxID=1305764 RepID=R9P9M6_PSEHS|nr:kinetochore protein mis13 [Pseudozyma hubeiensis SY62]GAC98093.1 kinetochore protein mis13 [Pseudozyma hubeiensis SY62]
MPATSRRTTRVSTSDSADARASSTSSKRKTGSSAASSTSSSTRSSAASSGVIPTVAARNASNKKFDRKERRLEDLLDDTIVADDARRVDISMGAFEPVKAASASSSKRSRQDAEAAARKLKQATARREEPPKTKRKLRQSESTLFPSLLSPCLTLTLVRGLRLTALGDESDDDFIFSREPARRNGAAVSSSSSSASTSSAPTTSAASRNGLPTSLSGRTVFEPLPDEAGGETPIIRRNQAFRAGLENKPRRPTGREAEQQSRRSSLNLKGQRRVSELRDGTVAHPHEDVPDYELYRHCSDQIPPVVRMKHIISWIIKRSLNIATGKAELPVRPRDAAKKTKGKAKESNELPTFNEAELKLLRSRESEVTAVLEQVLADLNEGVFGINWMGQNDEAKSKHLQPHPRNESNRKAAAQLSAIVDAMRSESQAWSKELTRLEDYEVETARLEALLQDDSTADSGDVIAWDRQDLDEAGLQQLRDAEAAVEWLGRLQGDATTETAKAKPRSKGRSSKAANARQDEEAADLKGTEHDARWNDVEYNVDLLRSQSHQFAQLESLASRYVRTVSAHAAQALRDRTSSSSALAGTSSSSAKGGRGKAAAKKGRGGGGSGQLEMLLSGVRESRSITQPTADASTAADQSVADVSASMAAVEPDESDPTDLLRALARMRD